jgi:hypothetical protein
MSMSRYGESRAGRDAPRRQGERRGAARPVPRPRGSALILALWTLFFLGALALAVGGYVSANLRVAGQLRREATAYYLARAGVAMAVSEALRNPTNYVTFANHAGLFRDVRSLPGGSVSVTYAFFDTNTSRVVTNYGILSEARKINLDDDSAATYARVEAIVGGDLAEAILTNYLAQKTVAGRGAKEYGAYESLQELLAVPGVGRRTFELLEPLTTISEHRFSHVGGRRVRRSSFGGVAEGRTLIREADGSERATAVRRVTFVFDSASSNMLYWREH